MKSELKYRLKRSLFLALIAVVIGAGIGYFQATSEKASVSSQGSQPMAGVSLNPDFALTDHTGKAVTNADYAGKYKLIYFGFTYCPAICPTELQKITRVLKAIGRDAENIQPLFITVDPERDTVPVMKDYVALFHPRLIGLTGRRTQIDQVLKNYRVFAKKVQDPEMNDYTMDHSSFIYLMSPEDDLLTMYRIQDDADFMTQDIRKRLRL